MGIAPSVAMNMSGHHVSNTTAAGLIPYDDHHHRRRRSLLLSEPPQTFHHGAHPPPSSSQNHRLSVTSVLSHWTGGSETTLALVQRLDDSFSRPTFGQITTSLVSRDGAERDDDQLLYSATITTTVSEPAREIPVCPDDAMMDDKQRECIETSLAVYPPSLLSERNLSATATPPSSSFGCTGGRSSWWSMGADHHEMTLTTQLATSNHWPAMSSRRTSAAVASAVSASVR